MGHEDFRRAEAVVGSSDRTFGLVIAAALTVVGLWPLVHGVAPRAWALATAVPFALLALLAPRALARLNRAWTALGVLLGRVVSPVATGVLFYGVFTPIGLLMRALGKDPLRLARDPAAATYWISRDPPGPAPGSLDQQF
jgi:hypothetical protein